MSETVPHSLPDFRAVLLEQVRFLGLALRREALALALVLAGVSALVLTDFTVNGERVRFEPDGVLLVAAVGFLLPFAVWKGEALFDGAYLWSLPVDRRRHALAKTLAGCVWLAAATAGFLGWLLSLSVLTGGGVQGEETRLLLTAPVADRPVAGEDLKTVLWSPPVWQWAALFTSGLVGYLLGTALRLGFKHPLRWVAGVFLGLLAAAILRNELFPNSPVEDVLQAVAIGPYGLDTALTGGVESLTTEVKRLDGESVVAWRGLPTFERWAGAAAFWTVLGLGGLWAALLRHRER